MYLIVGPSTPELEALKTELNKGSIYAFEQHPSGQEKLRELLRVLHGYNKKNTAGDIAVIQPEALMHKLQQDQDVYLSENHFASVDSNIRNCVSKISFKDIKDRQQKVTVYFDRTKITLDEVYMLQQIKAGGITKLSSSELNVLQSKASYVVIRAETKQYCKMDENASVLPEPISRVSYYCAFPNLESQESKDYGDFADEHGRLKNGGLLLKEKFKEILRLNRDIAALHREGFDVVTPNAFLSGLEKTEEQLKAKKIFAQAVYEVALESCPSNFLGFFVHEYRKIFQDQISQYKDIDTPVMIGVGADASSPMRACHALKNGYKVAESVMAHPLHAVGHGALGPRAESAKEENDDRVMLGDIEWMFSPALNANLLVKNKYIPMASGAPVLQKTYTTSYRAPSATLANSTQLKPREQFKVDMKKRQFHIHEISIVPDIRVKTKQVLKLEFLTASDAQKFAAAVELLTTKTPPVMIVDEKTVILGQDRAAVYFVSSGLTQDGKLLFNTLAQDQQRSPDSGCKIS